MTIATYLKGGLKMGLEKIAEYKRKIGMTTEALSQESGVPIGTLNKILSGATKDPKLETVKAIAHVLGLTLDDFDDEQPTTIAAHKIDTDDLDENEVDEVARYIEYIKSKRG